jgi:hypothetical protein
MSVNDKYCVHENSVRSCSRLRSTRDRVNTFSNSDGSMWVGSELYNIYFSTALNYSDTGLSKFAPHKYYYTQYLSFAFCGHLLVL